jgi:hypothetical protein
MTLVMTDEGGGTLLSCGALDDDDLEYGKYSECSALISPKPFAPRSRDRGT